MFIISFFLLYSIFNVLMFVDEFYVVYTYACRVSLFIVVYFPGAVSGHLLYHVCCHSQDKDESCRSRIICLWTAWIYTVWNSELRLIDCHLTFHRWLKSHYFQLAFNYNSFINCYNAPLFLSIVYSRTTNLHHHRHQ